MSELVRVAQVMGKMAGGGVESVVMNYYRHVDHGIVQFDFIVDDDSLLVPRDEIECLGGRVLEVPSLSRGVHGYKKALRSLLEQEGWLIVHSHVNALSVFPLGVAKRCGVPVRIAHSHSASGKGEYLKNAVKAILKTQSNRYPTHRFACSDHAGTWLFGSEADFAVMPNAIELDDFAFDDGVRAEVRHELDIDADVKIVGHVGRFMPQKNHVYLLNVFSDLVKRRSDVVLLLVGDGELKCSVEEKASDLGLRDKVRFLGQRSDMERIYQAFDLFLLPSLYEGLGLVGIEAQRAGLPCIFSSEVPHEVALTRRCRFIDIGDDDVSVWVDAADEALGRDRSLSDIEAFARYEIKAAAKKLTAFYSAIELKELDEVQSQIIL